MHLDQQSAPSQVQSQRRASACEKGGARHRSQTHKPLDLSPVRRQVGGARTRPGCGTRNLVIQDRGPRPSPRCALYVDAMIAAMPARPWMVLARSSRLACASHVHTISLYVWQLTHDNTKDKRVTLLVVSCKLCEPKQVFVYKS